MQREQGHVKGRGESLGPTPGVTLIHSHTHTPPWPGEAGPHPAPAPWDGWSQLPPVGLSAEGTGPGVHHPGQETDQTQLGESWSQRKERGQQGWGVLLRGAPCRALGVTSAELSWCHRAVVKAGRPHRPWRLAPPPRLCSWTARTTRVPLARSASQPEPRGGTPSGHLLTGRCVTTAPSALEPEGAGRDMCRHRCAHKLTRVHLHAPPPRSGARPALPRPPFTGHAGADGRPGTGRAGLTFRSLWTTPIWWQWRTASRIC